MPQPKPPIKFHEASCLSAFEPLCLGTRVENIDAFLEVVRAAVEAHDFSKDATPGQAFLTLPDEATQLVSAGVGPRSADSNDYVVRNHRGRVDAYLKRVRAAKPAHVAVVVYDRAAYLLDPDVRRDEIEYKLVHDGDCTHAIVAVIASAGPRPPVSPFCFVANMGGGNNAYLTKTVEELREEARAVVAYDSEWVVVSD